MVRQTKKLTALQIKNATKPGRLSDGDGLYLEVKPSGSKSWIFRYMIAGRRRDMGLGPERFFSLSEAREMAYEAKRLVLKGLDPIEVRKASRAQKEIDQYQSKTFRDCAVEFYEDNKPGWRNKKHRDQWLNAMERYAFPVIADLPTQSIETLHVLNVLKPIWYDKAETANRVRGRIESVLNAAKVKGYRKGENPARWKGHLDKLLPPRNKITPVQHHPAMPYEEVPALMQQLDGIRTVAADALQFLILTACRSGEVLNARWDEIVDDVWLVPAARMKAGKEHRVPLTLRAREILLRSPSREGYVFPGRKVGAAITNTSVRKQLAQLADPTYTIHGFRSTFRDWASEQGVYPYEVMETALAHTTQNKVEAAYRRTDLFENRRILMNDWTVACFTRIDQDDRLSPSLTVG